MGEGEKAGGGAFLKWAGGKGGLLPRLRALLPPGRRLVEPFCGSGAVFMGTDYPSYLLADGNPDLIALYSALRSEGGAFVDACARAFTPENNGRAAYEALRARFNALPPGARGRAELFVYLNRHCFNGLCRYNRAGAFNVPYRFHPAPLFPRERMLAFAGRAAGADLDLRAADFREVMAAARPGDVVYCDPPYLPLSPTASFGRYAAGGFGERDQADLADLCRALAARGVPVLVSNHDTPRARALYRGAAIEAVSARRSVGGQAHARQAAPEILALFAA